MLTVPASTKPLTKYRAYYSESLAGGADESLLYGSNIAVIKFGSNMTIQLDKTVPSCYWLNSYCGRQN